MILAIALTLFYPALAGREHSCFMTASGAPDWLDAVCFGSNQMPCSFRREAAERL
jgi:hypothetical protein